MKIIKSGNLKFPKFFSISNLLILVMTAAIVFLTANSLFKSANSKKSIKEENQPSNFEQISDSSSANSDKDSRQSVEVPIIMYHSVLDEGGFNDYVIPKQVLDSDIEYFQSKGYEAVFVNDLIRFVKYGEKLPEKPIVVSFDDGFYNNLSQALPVLENRSCKAIISVVGEYIELAQNEGYVGEGGSYLTLEDIDFLRSTGLIEIGNHTNAMHSLDGLRRGCMQIEGESLKDYTGALYSDIFTLQQTFDKIGFRPNVFAYPYGLMGENAPKIIHSCGFRATLGCGEKVNVITQGDPECLYGLGRFNRAYGAGSEEFFSFLKENSAES